MSDGSGREVRERSPRHHRVEARVAAPHGVEVGGGSDVALGVAQHEVGVPLQLALPAGSRSQEATAVSTSSSRVSTAALPAAFCRMRWNMASTSAP